MPRLAPCLVDGDCSQVGDRQLVDEAVSIRVCTKSKPFLPLHAVMVVESVRAELP